MPFVLIIGERSSSWAGRPSVVTLHNSKDEARAKLVDYVKRNWATEVGTRNPRKQMI